MKRKNGRTVSWCSVVLLLLFLAWSGAGLNLSGQSSKPVTLMEDPGVLRIVYGGDGGTSQRQGQQDEVVISGKLNAPSWANQATVYLSGWSGEYIEGDEHFADIKVVIKDIAFSGGVLEWKAFGLLADDNFDNPYRLSYCYIALFWNDGKLDAKPYDGNGSYNTATGACTGNLNFAEQKSNSRPMLVLNSYIYNKAFASAKEVAVLPRGFNLAFLPYGKTDHHLMQIAINFDHAEKIIGSYSYGHLPAPSLPVNASQVGLGYVSWQTQAILKDDDDSRDFRFWEHFSALAGDDVGVVQAPFSIVPYLHVSVGCVSHAGGVETESYTVKNIPYEYAVPVLTGWNIEADCPTDMDVLKLGVWVHDIQYSKKPADLLGLEAVAALPDLLPVPQSSDGSYCPQAGSKILSITIHNQGKVDAAASTTTVDFSPVSSVDVATPAIAAGKRVTLTVAVPSGCYVPNCKFKIRADSKLVVKESNEYNNDIEGECKG